MKTRLLAALLCSCAVCCSRQRASAAACQSACARVAGIKLAPKKAQMLANLHELDEKVDEAEEDSGKNIALLKEQLAQGGPPFDPKAFTRFPAATRRELSRRHEWEASQLKLQREQGIKNAEAVIADARKQYEDAKKSYVADEQKANDDAVQACLGPCLQRTPDYASCLQRTQAMEDIDICEHR